MKKEFLDVWVHDDGKLEELLKKKINKREKLHQWPLSYVEKITLEDDTRVVYKSQHSAASVEKEFYSNIKMPFLTSPIYTETFENCDILILPYLDYPVFGKTPESDWDRVITEINDMIQGCSGMPVFFDLSSVEKVMQIIDNVGVIFHDKIEYQDFMTLKNQIPRLIDVCYNTGKIGYVHGDLNPSNVLIENGKPRYILDWQRPMIAPVLLENALAFRLARYDAIARYGEFGILAIICHFIWYSYACKKLLPFVYDIASKLLSEIVDIINKKTNKIL